MNLLEIRQKFVKLSGREDLLDVSGNFFIQGAVTDLDLEQETGEDFNWYEESFAIGDYKTKMKHCRSIQAVWFVDSDDETVLLSKLLYDEFVVKYPALGETDDGTPAHWAKNPLQRDPDNRLAGTSVEYTGAIIMPPTDEAVTIKIYGVFHSVPLEEDEDENFWSVRYPNLLVMAALRNLEGFYRNTQGYNDFDKIIQRKLIGIDKDLAEANTAGEMKMKG